MKKPKTLKDINLFKFVNHISGTEEKLANKAVKSVLREEAIEWIKHYLEIAEIELKEYYLHDINPNKISKYIKLEGKIEALMEFFNIDKNVLNER